MTVDVRWYDDAQTIVLYTFHPKWTREDFYPAFEKALAMEHSKPYRVDVIIDYGEPYMVPIGLIENLRQITSKQPQTLDLTVVASHHQMAVMMIRVASNIIPVIRDHFRVAPTVQDAYRIIQQDRQNEAAGAIGGC